ncbi:hypothetical protein Glove_185g59 [Diversispora epigaea]|uniref:SH3 domain-containing protein n=1 Tax=Diversispora epigaea TaxID=1348612 RepID=A0A397IQ87_9GLOM|nr:hypothetical protein Glove_185g59 [Diversispora epigaea]
MSIMMSQLKLEKKPLLPIFIKFNEITFKIINISVEVFDINYLVIFMAEIFHWKNWKIRYQVKNLEIIQDFSEDNELFSASPENCQALPSARALFDYAAEDLLEISFSEGNIITDIKFTSEDWWESTTKGGSIGFFPG